MIRYIDIGVQLMEDNSQFAWYDTVRDEFFEFNENQVWYTWENFKDDFWFEVNFRKKVEPEFKISEPEEYLERFKGLFPKEKK